VSYIIGTAIALSHSVSEKVNNHTLHLQDDHSVNGFCNSRPNILCLKQRFHPLTNVSLGLRPPTFTKNVWPDENPHAIRSVNFESTCGLAFQMTDTGPHIYSTSYWTQTIFFFSFSETSFSDQLEDLSLCINLHMWFQHHITGEVHQ
jgi:hypothetical protein